MKINLINSSIKAKIYLIHPEFIFRLIIANLREQPLDLATIKPLQIVFSKNLIIICEIYKNWIYIIDLWLEKSEENLKIVYKILFSKLFLKIIQIKKIKKIN